jgi:acyl carrier protein
MDENSIISLLNDIFRDIIEDDEISLSRDLTADDVDGWDSLNHTLIISEIQKKFEIKFNLTEVLGFEKVGDLVDSILDKKA